MSLIQDVRELLAREDVVILDTETTGTAPYSDEIVEVAIIRMDGTVLLNSLVRPVWPIPAEAADIHGITDEMVQQEDVPLFPEIFPRIVQATQGKLVVIFNAWFDSSFLKSLTQRYELSYAPIQCWCLMEAYAEYWGEERRDGGYKWQSLEKACSPSQQNVGEGQSHRALGDAQLVLTLMQKLAEKEEEE